MDVYVYAVPLPGRVRETVTYNADGSYTVLIKESLSPLEQARSYAHARRHIENGDFEKEDVALIEIAAHEMSGAEII